MPSCTAPPLHRGLNIWAVIGAKWPWSISFFVLIHRTSFSILSRNNWIKISGRTSSLSCCYDMSLTSLDDLWRLQGTNPRAGISFNMHRITDHTDLSHTEVKKTLSEGLHTTSKIHNKSCHVTAYIIFTFLRSYNYSSKTLQKQMQTFTLWLFPSLPIWI